MSLFILFIYNTHNLCIYFYLYIVHIIYVYIYFYLYIIHIIYISAFLPIEIFLSENLLNFSKKVFSFFFSLFVINSQCYSVRQDLLKLFLLLLFPPSKKLSSSVFAKFKSLILINSWLITYIYNNFLD